jgi:molecular chaperone GrpE
MGEEEEDGLRISASEEMEAALREATEAVEGHERGAAGAGAPAAGGSTDKLTIELLSEELRALKSEFDAREAALAEANDRLLRLQAEFENFRRRGLKERQEALQFGHQNLVKDLLSTVDNLERAIEHSEQNAGADLRGLLQGVELVRRELLAALGKHGVSVIEARDEVFDPTLHEAMGQIPDDSVPPGTIVQVLQKGYQLHDRMLRPARVMVAAAPGKGERGASGTGRGE